MKLKILIYKIPMIQVNVPHNIHLPNKEDPELRETKINNLNKDNHVLQDLRIKSNQFLKQEKV